jgi:hypothetical protein
VIHERAVSGNRSSFTLFLSVEQYSFSYRLRHRRPTRLGISASRARWCKCRSNATEDDGSAVARRVAVHDKFIATDLKDYGAYNDGAS